MKFFSFIWIGILVILLTAVSCVKEEADECVNALDCSEGYLCIDGACVQGESLLDDNDNQNKTDDVKNDENEKADTAVNDDSVVVDEEGFSDQDSVDEKKCTDDTCSGFGTCEIVDGVPVCTCDEFHKGADCSECVAGYHIEEADDDENGDGKFSCVKNVACVSEPCNGGECTDKGMTAVCKCLDGYIGRWCTECDSGYLKSTVDQKCKPDCAKGSYSCTGTKECGVDPAKNEAGCVCKEYFSGADCLSCDAAHFCSNNGMCSVSEDKAVCSCNQAWSGNDNCSACTPGYLFEGGNCIQGCTDYCGAKIGFLMIDGTLYTVVATSYGTCKIVSGSAKCECEQGWKTSLSYTLPGQIKPACSDCDTANPPTGGCPE